MGQIKGSWIEEERKVDIVMMIESGKERGVSITRACAFWSISRRRVTRWRKQWKEERSLKNLKPGPKYPIHKLLPMERAAVLEMAVKEEYADLSHRILTVTGWDLGSFFVSFSSVYRILRSVSLISMRGKQRHHNGRSLPPVRKELTGPNQRWCWDISYLRTYEKGVFLYLYLLLDEYSRKVIQWLVSWNQTSEEARRLLDGGLTAENILDLPEDQRPEIINDRGRQMKARSIKKMFEDHQMPQLFARPRTPNDNPYVESLFGKVKTASPYPGYFLDHEEAERYFDRYFRWYNTEHLHSGIDYVTPEQCHQGLGHRIVANRKQNLRNQQRFRKEVNRASRSSLTNAPMKSIVKPNEVIFCSVMNL